MAKYLFGEQESLYAFGGYEDAERKMLIFLPDYLDEASLYGEDSPCVCLRAAFFQGDSPSHRDFLGALMGAGVGRETVGDICVDKGSCDFFVTAEIAPYLLQNFTSAGAKFPFRASTSRSRKSRKSGTRWHRYGWTASYPPDFVSGGVSPPST